MESVIKSKSFEVSYHKADGKRYKTSKVYKGIAAARKDGKMLLKLGITDVITINGYDSAAHLNYKQYLTMNA